MEVIKFFGFDYFEEQILGDIQKNFVEYDCFTLLHLSKKWEYSDL